MSINGEGEKENLTNTSSSFLDLMFAELPTFKLTTISLSVVLATSQIRADDRTSQYKINYRGERWTVSYILEESPFATKTSADNTGPLNKTSNSKVSLV
jgi:hypothetical protein